MCRIGVPSARLPALYAAELLDDIERACEEGLVDPGYIRFDDVKCDLWMGKECVLARLVDNPHRHLVDDTVAEMGWWACFHEDRARKTARAVADANLNQTYCPPRSGEQRRRSAGTNHVLAAAARNTRSVAAHERLNHTVRRKCRGHSSLQRYQTSHDSDIILDPFGLYHCLSRSKLASVSDFRYRVVGEARRHLA